MDPSANYEIDVAGRRFQAVPHVYPPKPANSSAHDELSSKPSMYDLYVPVVARMKEKLSWADFVHEN